MRRSFLLTLAVFVSASAFPAAQTGAAQSGTIQGKITFNGKMVPLSFVYAWKELDYEGKKVRTNLLLSAEKVSDAAMADMFGLNDLAKAGKLHGVEVTFNADGDIVSGMLYTDATEGGYVGASGMHNFEKKLMTSTSIEGRLSMEKEDNSLGLKFFYDATFKAPIAPVRKAK
jgi:hypothetical protein